MLTLCTFPKPALELWMETANQRLDHSLGATSSTSTMQEAEADHSEEDHVYHDHSMHGVGANTISWYSPDKTIHSELYYQ